MCTRVRATQRCYQANHLSHPNPPAPSCAAPNMYVGTPGMQFFGGALPDVEESLDNSIRFNYNSFGKAAITILDLFTGNRWSEVRGVSTAHERLG